MSDAQMQSTQPMATRSLSIWMVYGAIAMSILSSIAFILALVIAYLSKDQTNVQLLVGAVVSNFSTVMAFWLGSSAGSQRKDELLGYSPKG